MTNINIDSFVQQKVAYGTNKFSESDLRKLGHDTKISHAELKSLLIERGLVFVDVSLLLKDVFNSLPREYPNFNQIEKNINKLKELAKKDADDYADLLTDIYGFIAYIQETPNVAKCRQLTPVKICSIVESYMKKYSVVSGEKSGCKKDLCALIIDLFKNSENINRYQMSLQNSQLKSVYSKIDSYKNNAVMLSKEIDNIIADIKTVVGDNNIAYAIFNQKIGKLENPYYNFEKMIVEMCPNCGLVSSFSNRVQIKKAECKKCKATFAMACPNPKCTSDVFKSQAKCPICNIEINSAIELKNHLKFAESHLVLGKTTNARESLEKAKQFSLRCFSNELEEFENKLEVKEFEEKFKTASETSKFVLCLEIVSKHPKVEVAKAYFRGNLPKIANLAVDINGNKASISWKIQPTANYNVGLVSLVYTIVRCEGREPANESDGIVVAREIKYNKYTETIETDSKTYYYKVFAKFIVGNSEYRFSSDSVSCVFEAEVDYSHFIDDVLKENETESVYKSPINKKKILLWLGTPTFCIGMVLLAVWIISFFSSPLPMFARISFSDFFATWGGVHLPSFALIGSFIIISIISVTFFHSTSLIKLDSDEGILPFLFAALLSFVPLIAFPIIYPYESQGFAKFLDVLGVIIGGVFTHTLTTFFLSWLLLYSISSLLCIFWDIGSAYKKEKQRHLMITGLFLIAALTYLIISVYPVGEFFRTLGILSGCYIIACIASVIYLYKKEDIDFDSNEVLWSTKLSFVVGCIGGIYFMVMAFPNGESGWWISIVDFLFTIGMGIVVTTILTFILWLFLQPAALISYVLMSSENPAIDIKRKSSH